MLKKIQKFTSSNKRLRLSCTGYASKTYPMIRLKSALYILESAVGTKSKIIKKNLKIKVELILLIDTVRCINL